MAAVDRTRAVGPILRQPAQEHADPIPDAPIFLSSLGKNGLPVRPIIRIRHRTVRIASREWRKTSCLDRFCAPIIMMGTEQPHFGVSIYSSC
jgi:hypothetical protein